MIKFLIKNVLSSLKSNLRRFHDLHHKHTLPQEGNITKCIIKLSNNSVVCFFFNFRNQRKIIRMTMRVESCGSIHHIQPIINNAHYFGSLIRLCISRITCNLCGSRTRRGGPSYIFIKYTRQIFHVPHQF